jgi:hypothetical protein
MMGPLQNYNQDTPLPKVKLRPASIVMRLNRMGAFHQSRLSFMRVLLRKLKAENWSFDRPIWRLNKKGVGVATYCVRGPESTYTLVVFSHDLKDDLRSDRVIATAWDATFTLFDGEIDEEQIIRLRSNVPLQEAGRISETELVLSRANKSVRLFSYVRECLSKGVQPDRNMIDQVGYLMRTTAVYGSGKFGAADLGCWSGRSEFSGSFQPEMLTVWLIRTFSVDLVEHMARIDSPKTCVKLDPEIRRQLGVGNATGLGMAPFLINHPTLIHSWVLARETALARVRSVDLADVTTLGNFKNLVRRAKLSAKSWIVNDPHQIIKIEGLRRDLDALLEKSSELSESTLYPWDILYEWGMTQMSNEGQEALVSLMMEPYGTLVDDLSLTMSADETTLNRIDGQQTTSALKELICKTYDWADSIDFDAASARARVWYISEEKLEPRLGERSVEELEEFEQPLSPGYDAMKLFCDLSQSSNYTNVAEFLLSFPEHRHIVRRVQIIASKEYAEIQDNTIAAEMMPIDLLRCKLSFFGATKFDPRSDRWLRINLFQHMPFPNELSKFDPDDMVFPQLID